MAGTDANGEGGGTREVATFDAGTGAAGTASLDASGLPAGAEGTGRHPNPVVLREAVLMYEANRRVGTASTKERHFVSGSTKKMYRQKHTGNARQGDGKAPHFRGGGVCFGPHPRSYSYAMPKKSLKRALGIALSLKVEDGEVTLVTGFALEKPSTKAYAKMLAAAKAGTSPLLVTAGPAPRNVLLSNRNLQKSRVLPAAEVNARDVAACSRLLLAEGAYEALLARICGRTAETAGTAAGTETAPL